MVCDKCQAKLGKVIVPDKWKDGARNTTGSFRQPHYGPTSSCRGRPKVYLAASRKLPNLACHRGRRTKGWREPSDRQGVQASVRTRVLEAYTKA